MKHYLFRNSTALFGVFVCSIMLVCPVLYAQDDLTADSILHIMTETMNPDQAQGKMTMTIITTSGDERTFLYETYSKNQGEKSLMKYLEPTRVKGQTILMLNDADDIWTFFPKVQGHHRDNSQSPGVSDTPYRPT